MEQREKLERNANAVTGSGQEAMGDSISNERLNIEATTPRKIGGSQISLGRVVARLQAAGKALRDPARSVPSALEAPLPKSTEELSEETVQADALIVDVAGWVRRLLIPLAILAWAGVAILLLWAAGYVTRTILLLVIAMLLAYALSPFASPVAGVLQALLVAIWPEWRETHPQAFQAAKDKVAEQVEKNVAEKPLNPETDPEPEAKLLS